MSAAEIQESIIGNTLTEAETGRWKEDYLPIGGDRREGIILGHQRAPEYPYGGTWSIEGDSMCLNYSYFPEQSGCYHFSRGNESKILWFDEADRLAFDTKLIERDDTEATVVESISPAFRQETLTFRHGENLLVGDIRFPAGPGPYPAVVFVVGSGPASRHDYAFWPAKAVPDEFLSRGFATFIWSKPGVDESTGDYMKQTYALRAEEAAAAIAHLAARADIDGDRIGFWGGSQAGWVMPLDPAYRNAAFVIAVACPGLSGVEHEMHPVDNELVSIGISGGDRADAREHIRTILETLQIAPNYEEFIRSQKEWLAEAKQRPWYPTVESNLDQLGSLGWIFPIMDRVMFNFVFAAFDKGAPPPLNNLRMPVLAIFGSNDSRVDAEVGAKMYEGIPLANGNRDVTVKVFDGANHSLMLPDSEGYMEYAPDYLATMGEWLSERR